MMPQNPGMRIFDIPVKIGHDSGGFIVTDFLINMYGTGTTRDAAVADYKANVKEYREGLLTNDGKLGDRLKYHLSYLNSLPTFRGIANHV